MKRVFDFLCAQQLVVPLTLFMSGFLWLLLTKRWSWEEFRHQPYDYLFPLITTVAVLAIWIVILAAKDLNQELATKVANYQPKIIYTD